jgi:hypothetical protein
MSHNPMGLHDLLQGQFCLFTTMVYALYCVWRKYEYTAAMLMGKYEYFPYLITSTNMLNGELTMSITFKEFAVQK